MNRSRIAAVAGVAVVALAGCGETRTVTKTVHSAASARHHHHRRKRARLPAGYRRCGRSIQAKTVTTTCGFAENVFFSYAALGHGPQTVYSPATKKVYAVMCRRRAATVTCVNADGSVVRFPTHAADTYTGNAADRFRASHDLGPPAAVPPPPTTTESTPAPGPDIPNYPNGSGYRVQCADGTFSDSGGIQGACSHHGGEMP